MDESTDSVDQNVRALREGLERMNRQMTNIGNEVTSVKVNVEGVRSSVQELGGRVDKHESNRHSNYLGANRHGNITSTAS